MSIFTDLIFIYVYIATLIFLGFINFDTDNYLLQKLYLFISISIFTSLMETLNTFKTNCKKTGRNIFNESVKIGTVAVIGLMIYTDLLHMNWSQEIFENINSSNFNRSLIIPLIIVLTIMIVKLTSVVFDSDEDKCDEIADE